MYEKPLKYLTTDLKLFWLLCDKRRTSGRIDLLRDFSKLRFSGKGTRVERRGRFNDNKMYTTWLKRPCFACGGKSNVRHHIIQLQHGGTNRGENVVPLCHSCHSEVHPWLKK